MRRPWPRPTGIESATTSTCLSRALTASPFPAWSTAGFVSPQIMAPGHGAPPGAGNTLRKEGYLVSDRTAMEWLGCAHSPSARSRYSSCSSSLGAVPPRPGERHVQPELDELCDGSPKTEGMGSDSGPVAEDMVAALRRRGGLHTLDDFEEAAGEYVTPIRADYHGFEVVQMPPNSQALVAPIMLNVLAGLDHRLDPSGAERLHLEIEAAPSSLSGP